MTILDGTCGAGRSENPPLSTSGIGRGCFNILSHLPYSYGSLPVLHVLHTHTHTECISLIFLNVLSDQARLISRLLWPCGLSSAGSSRADGRIVTCRQVLVMKILSRCHSVPACLSIPSQVYWHWIVNGLTLKKLPSHAQAGLRVDSGFMGFMGFCPLLYKFLLVPGNDVGNRARSGGSQVRPFFCSSWAQKYPECCADCLLRQFPPLPCRYDPKKACPTVVRVVCARALSGQPAHSP